MGKRCGALLAFLILSLCSSPAHSVIAGGSHTRLTPSSRVVRQRLFITPLCFVAGRRTWAHVRLTHAGPHAEVEFVWALAGVTTLGPGLGPGYFHSNATGVVRFAAIAPSRYGHGTVGSWNLGAEWPKASHPFVRVRFKIVANAGDC